MEKRFLYRVTIRLDDGGTCVVYAVASSLQELQRRVNAYIATYTGAQMNDFTADDVVDRLGVAVEVHILAAEGQVWSFVTKTGHTEYAAGVKSLADLDALGKWITRVSFEGYAV